MRDYLLKYQNVIYNTLLNSKKNNRFPHAILLNGNKDIPLIEIAKYVAAWVASDDEEINDEDETYLKINNDMYPDFILIDGKDQTIKKGQIENLQERFSLSAVSENAKKIYVINIIEHANSESVNALLKFLEEPSDDIYAIITTENINYVLPTIVSRCLNLRLNKVNREELINEAINKGIDKEDALVLSSFNGSFNLLEDCYNNSKYVEIKDLVIELFEEYNKGNNILYFSQINMGDVALNKTNFRMFLDLLELFLLDVANNSSDIHFINHKSLLEELKDKIKNRSTKIVNISDYKEAVELNANLKLLLDKVIIELKEE